MYGVKCGIQCEPLDLIGTPAEQDVFRLYFERRGARRHLLGPLRRLVQCPQEDLQSWLCCYCTNVS